MDTMTMNGEDVRHELQELEKAQACKQPRRLGRKPPKQTGGMATMAATQAGTVAAVAAGGIGLVVGMFLSLAIVHTTRTHY